MVIRKQALWRTAISFVGAVLLQAQLAEAALSSPLWVAKTVRRATLDSVAAQNPHPDPDWLPQRAPTTPAWEPRKKTQHPLLTWQPEGTSVPAIPDVDQPQLIPLPFDDHAPQAHLPRQDAMDVLEQDMMEQSQKRLIDVLRASNLFLNVLRFDDTHTLRQRIAVFDSLQRLGSPAEAFDDAPRLRRYLHKVMPNTPSAVRRISRIIQQEPTSKQALWPQADPALFASKPVHPGAFLNAVLSRIGEFQIESASEGHADIAVQISRCVQLNSVTAVISDALARCLVLSGNGQTPACVDARAANRCKRDCADRCAVDDDATEFMAHIAPDRLLNP